MGSTGFLLTGFISEVMNHHTLEPKPRSAVDSMLGVREWFWVEKV